MVERLICCFGASSWAKVVAWYHIFVSSLTVLFWCAAFVALWLRHFSVEGKVEWEAVVRLTLFIIILLLILILLALLPLIFAVILMRATANKDSEKIGKWITFARVLLLIWTLLVICVGIVSVSLQAFDNSVMSLLLNGAIHVAFQAFSLWVVGVHREELLLPTEEPIDEIPWQNEDI